MLKINILDVYSHNIEKIKIDLDGRLPLEKTLTMQYTVINNKSAF